MGFSKYEAFLQVFPYTNPSIGHVPYLFLRLLENHQRFLKSGSYLPVAIFVEVPEEPQLLALPRTKFWWWLSQRWILVDCGETYLGDLGWAWWKNLSETSGFLLVSSSHNNSHSNNWGRFWYVPNFRCILKWWCFNRKLQRGNFPVTFDFQSTSDPFFAVDVVHPRVNPQLLECENPIHFHIGDSVSLGLPCFTTYMVSGHPSYSGNPAIWVYNPTCDFSSSIYGVFLCVCVLYEIPNHMQIHMIL